MNLLLQLLSAQDGSHLLSRTNSFFTLSCLLAPAAKKKLNIFQLDTAEYEKKTACLQLDLATMHAAISDYSTDSQLALSLL